MKLSKSTKKYQKLRCHSLARKGKMYDQEIDSKFLQEKKVIKIYEPEQFDSLYENKVCIMQDGDDYFHLGRIATLSDKLHDEGDIVNTIFVGIHYIDRFDRLKKYHPNGEQFEAYTNFLTKEVIPLLDEILPINPLGTVRTLMGDSLAGTIALTTALKYPDLFQQVVMQSPLVDETVLEIVKQARNVDSLDVYHSIGLRETEVPTTAGERVNFVNPNEQLAEILKEKLIDYEYVKIEDGNHTWKYWQKELPSILEKMFS